jgi:hypothetical protein
MCQYSHLNILQFEKETGLPRRRLEHVVSTLPRADLDGNGVVDQEEWDEHVRKFSRNKIRQICISI